MSTQILLLLLLSSYGLCFGIMNDKVPLLHHLRKVPLLKDEEGHPFFARMFVCPYCTGFHTGWLVYLLWAAVTDGFDPTKMFLAGIVLFGFASSAICYLLDTLIQWFEHEQ